MEISRTSGTSCDNALYWVIGLILIWMRCFSAVARRALSCFGCLHCIGSAGALQWPNILWAWLACLDLMRKMVFVAESWR